MLLHIHSFDDIWDANTSTVWEGGSAVSWTYSAIDDKHKDMKWYTTLDRLQSGYFKVVAMDEKEVSISREIGEGKTKIRMPSLFSRTEATIDSNAEITIEVNLTNKISGLSSGIIMVTLSLTSEIYQLSSTERKITPNITPPDYVPPKDSKKEVILGSKVTFMYTVGEVVEGQYKGGGQW
jgi:hypothetical protein